MVELVVRLVFSLAVIVGMLMLLTRFSARKFRGGSGALVHVVHRQPLSRTSAVAVVTVGSRVLVVGTTEHQVQLLTELDPEELVLPMPLPMPVAVPVPSSGLADDGGVRDAPGGPGTPSSVTVPFEELFSPYEPRHAAPDSAPAPAPAAPALAAVRAARSARVAEGALAGSVLSAQTWKQALAAATNRTRDAS